MANPKHCFQIWTIRDAETNGLLNVEFADTDDSIYYHGDDDEEGEDEDEDEAEEAADNQEFQDNGDE